VERAKTAYSLLSRLAEDFSNGEKGASATLDGPLTLAMGVME
jgi:hypothetical protein